MRTPFIEFLREHSRFVILSHVDPDGDAIGSALGLAWILRDAGKSAQVLLPGGTPELYAFLTGADDIGAVAADANLTDAAVIAVDATSPSRLGELASLLERGRPVANVDHHGDNARFGDVDLVDSSACATALILWEVAGDAGFRVSKAAAENLYAGVLTDTGRFSYTNTDQRTLQAAAELAGAGAEPFTIANAVYGTRTIASVRLLGRALETLDLREGGTVASIHVTQAMLRETGATQEDAEGFSSWPRSLAGVKVGIFLRETEDGMIKISFRSSEGVQIDGVAGRFGGGGHPSASGARISGSIEEAKQAVLQAVSEHLRSTV
ncbi:MAG: phosphoesterase [Gemmatimonadota bacterium]|nr:MAG: phosphoesterase [Gemmatimonadota bacterium]